MENREQWAWSLAIAFFMIFFLMLNELRVLNNDNHEMQEKNQELCSLLNRVILIANNDSELLEYNSNMTFTRLSTMDCDNI